MPAQKRPAATDDATTLAYEQQLVARLQDEATARMAFYELVNTYQRQLYAVIRRLVHSHAATDDVLQETFIKAWQALPKFKAESKLSTWLYRIATNEALGYLRKHKRHRHTSLDDTPEELQPTALHQAAESSPSPDADAIRARLEAAIEHLPDKQRAVFQLRYYDEMPYEEMATVLGTSVGALKASYHHAVKKVEAYLLAH